MRKPNHADAELLLHLYEIRREPEMRKARAWFLTDFRVQGWEELRGAYLSHTDTDRWFRMVVTYWETVATLVNRGVLHPDLLFDTTGEDVVVWQRCKAWIDGARADIRPTYLYQFEKMVNDHLAFRQRAIAALPRKGAKPPAGPRARARRRAR